MLKIMSSEFASVSENYFQTASEIIQIVQCDNIHFFAFSD
jgi:hypothetical protein